MMKKLMLVLVSLMTALFLAGAIYLILIGIVTILAKKVEKKYSYYR